MKKGNIFLAAADSGLFGVIAPPDEEFTIVNADDHRLPPAGQIILAENELKPWRKDMWCIPQIDGNYVARMEDVLDLYAEEPDPKRPVVCFDESPTQLIGEVRQPIPAAPGRLGRYDCEYRRNGTVNLFIFLDAHSSWRKVKVTEQRTARDFAQCMRDLVEVHYPKAEQIRVVLDNLSTHSTGALYEAFPAPEAHRILRRLEFHYTPKHASWLNMVESKSGCCAVSAWIDASANATNWFQRLQPGKDSATMLAPVSTGCSPPRKPDKSWRVPIPTQPKSHNPCATVLSDRVYDKDRLVRCGTGGFRS